MARLVGKLHVIVHVCIPNSLEIGAGVESLKPGLPSKSQSAWDRAKAYTYTKSKLIK